MAGIYNPLSPIRGRFPQNLTGSAVAVGKVVNQCKVRMGVEIRNTDSTNSLYFQFLNPLTAVPGSITATTADVIIGPGEFNYFPYDANLVSFYEASAGTPAFRYTEVI